MSGKNANDLPLPEKSAIRQLREFLLSDDAVLLSRSFDRGLAEITLQALYLDLNGKTVSKLEHDLTGANWFRDQQTENVQTVRKLFALPETVAPAPAPARHPIAPDPELALAAKPTLAQLLSEAEKHRGIALVLLKASGSDPEIRLPRLALFAAARQLGYKADEITAVFPAYDTAKICEAKMQLDLLLEKSGFPRFRTQVQSFFTKLGVTR